MDGWQGRILRIDLDHGTHTVETPDPALYQRFLGGRGLAGYYLLDFVTLPWDDPQMPLLLFTGPLVDTPAPTSGRMTIMSRSPLTGTVGDCSVGGTLGTSMKKAGWDGVIITGRSRRLCGIEIAGDTVTFADAAALKGMDTQAACRLLKDKGAVAVIGPAAEQGVRFANVIVDGHFAAGRGGIGLTFAAKNLHYITIRGQGKTSVHDPDTLRVACEDVRRLIAASPALSGESGLSPFGTPALYDLMDARRMMPTGNFRRTHFPGAAAMNAPAFKERYQPKRTGCRGCHILCKKVAQDGRILPEFESLSHFSALIDNTDIETVMEANRLCNALGMDTISAASTLACHAELTGAILNPAQILALLEDIAAGRGIGTELGQGAAAYTRAQGRPELAMAVKGLELPAYDPRGAYGMALAYALSTRGGCHLRAYPISHEILRKPVATDRFSFAGKARIIKIAEDMHAVVDSLTACKFVFFAASLEEYAKVFTAVTGVPSSAQDLLKIGARIYYQERMMNAANGFTASDDDLPGRFFAEAGSCGLHIPIPPLDRSEFLAARSRYYRIRGLDEKGLPQESAARELGLAYRSDLLVKG